MKQGFLLLIAFISQWGFSQTLTPADLGFEGFEIENPDFGKINYYISLDKSGKKKPLLVYLDGSGSDPIFQETNSGIGSTIAFDYQNLAKDFTLLLICKPGVPFFTKVEGDERFPAPKTYTERLSLDWRVGTANLIIEQLVKQQKIDPERVVVLGFSEGAQVAPFLAETNKRVTQVLLFGGNGLNQFFDPIITARLKAQRGEISEEKAQHEIDSLYTVYDQIYADPDATNKNWWGHTYKRWSSFTMRDPLDALVNLNIPIYMANGSLDENSILSADYIKLEFIKHRKKNLTYKSYPGYDHQFNELLFENGKFKGAVPQIDKVLDEAFKWIKTTK